jgi:hypothetical protein
MEAPQQKYYGCVYSIYCLDPTVKPIYVGTTHDLGKTRREFKINCTNENAKDYNDPLYNFIRQNGDWKRFKLIKCVEVRTGQADLLKAEKLKIASLECCLNKKLQKQAGAQAYRETHKERTKDYNHEYYFKNKEEIAIITKEKITCMCGSTFRRCAKARHLKSRKHNNFIESQA